MRRRTKELIKHYIKSQQIAFITKALTNLICDHDKWKKSGLGYVCKDCGYYTGTNNDLNDSIKKL